MRSVLLLLVLAFTGCATSVPIAPVADSQPPVITDPRSVGTIAIEKIVMQVPVGQQTGSIGLGLLCIPSRQLTANTANNMQLPLRIVDQQFRMTGYPVSGSPEELFSSDSASVAQFRLAGRITNTNANACFPWAGLGDLSNGKASAHVELEWQVYDNARKAIVLKIPTEGYGSVESTANPLLAAEQAAFGMATRRLLSDPRFQAVMVQPSVQSLAKVVASRR